MHKHVMVVLTNAVEGEDEAYNDWYDNQHLADVLAIPGIVSARRFKLSQQQRSDPPHPFGYLALYEIESDDLDAVIAELKTRAGSAVMPISGSLAAERMTLVFEPFGATAAAPATTVGGF